MSGLQHILLEMLVKIQKETSKTIREKILVSQMKLFHSLRKLNFMEYMEYGVNLSCIDVVFPFN